MTIMMILAYGAARAALGARLLLSVVGLFSGGWYSLRVPTQVYFQHLAPLKYNTCNPINK